MEKEVRICSEIPGFPDRTGLEITMEALAELWDEINQSYLGIKINRGRYLGSTAARAGKG